MPVDPKIYNASNIFANANTMLIATFGARESHTGAWKVCFLANDFATGAAAISAIPESQEHCEDIALVIGIFRDRLVFLQKDGWICSIRANGMRGQDWLRTNSEPLIAVTKLGDVLFVVKGEVAVVKKGLNRIVDVKPFPRG
ncbi:hypothetical protein PG993_006946 [Apiospora rasikravindrae]|uniref:Uncharacterized protein n=1 Tax=Apiospora rasikravindrae TaxID=990691 RepID=A0ABR1SW38_9PEZI